MHVAHACFVVVLLLVATAAGQGLPHGHKRREPRINGDVLILQMGRCGSTILMRSLWTATDHNLLGFPKMSSPQAPELGKMLKPYPLRKESAFPYNPDGRASQEEIEWQAEQVRKLRVDAHNLAGGARFVVESVKMNQVWSTGLSVPDLLKVGKLAGFSHLVVLHRSYLRSHLSFDLVEHSKGEWHVWQKGTDGKTNCVPMNMTVATNRYALMHRMYRDAVTQSSFRDMLLVSYENHIYNDVRRATANILSWLSFEVPPLLAPELSKTADCPLQDVLQNYGEFEKALAGTPLEWLLEREGLQRQSKGALELILGTSP